MANARDMPLLVTCRNRDSEGEGTRQAKHAHDRVLLSGNRGNVRLLFMSHEMSNADDDEQSDDYTFWASSKSRDAMRVTQTRIEMHRGERLRLSLRRGDSN
jgi:hypothetical protein